METLNLDSDSSGYETDREASEAPIMASDDIVIDPEPDLAPIGHSGLKRSREPSDGPPAGKKKRSVPDEVEAEPSVARMVPISPPARPMPRRSNGVQSTTQPIVISDSSDLEMSTDSGDLHRAYSLVKHSSYLNATASCPVVISATALTVE
jgi:hypothetical protein